MDKAAALTLSIGGVVPCLPMPDFLSCLLKNFPQNDVFFTENNAGDF